jgi:hypothetical protein
MRVEPSPALTILSVVGFTDLSVAPMEHLFRSTRPKVLARLPTASTQRAPSQGNTGMRTNVRTAFCAGPGGTIVSFDPPDAILTLPTSINDAGAITGLYIVANGRALGFVRDPHGKFTSFDPGPDTFPKSINDEGAITGYSASDLGESNPHGFVRSPDGTINSSFGAGVPVPGAVPPKHLR